MSGLTPLGIVHTAISIVALIAGFYALIRDKEISIENTPGKIYLWATVLTCITGFGIFQHGGFGKPHALGVLTLVVLGIGALPRLFRMEKKWRAFMAATYTLTLFFHFIPGLTETFTRVPLGGPFFSSPDDPTLANVVGLVFAVFAIGIFFQIRRLRKLTDAASGSMRPVDRPGRLMPSGNDDRVIE
ncbi:MAG: hypothetical protein Q7T87_12650 [Polaromonas sp.]|nr:hypothetical protein [Polaromonas sp.]